MRYPYLMRVMCGLDCSSQTGTFSFRNWITENGRHTPCPECKVLLRVRMYSSATLRVRCGLELQATGSIGYMVTGQTTSPQRMDCQVTPSCGSFRIARASYGSRRLRESIAFATCRL